MRLGRHRPAAGGPERQDAIMASKSPRRLSEQERAERRRQDRERLQQAARELLSSEGWARWVRSRAMFHSCSAGNCMLLAAQCHQRGMVPTRIAGFRTWLKLGRMVRKGESALRILAPVTYRVVDAITEAVRQDGVVHGCLAALSLGEREVLVGPASGRSTQR
jgi:hypothetical protein